MSSTLNKMAGKLSKIISESDNRKPKSYDTKAVVRRIDDTIVWVKIPGGNDETPVSKTNNARVGDEVMVRVSRGRAWLLGNNTSPATDDTQANAATQLAEGAEGLAKAAENSAQSAQAAADAAWSYADTAHTAAKDASKSAASASADAAQAKLDAGEAHDRAVDATRSSTSALNQLSVVQDISGVLNWFEKHGSYQITSDSSVDPSKWYFKFVRTYFKTSDEEIDQNKTYYTVLGHAYNPPDMGEMYEYDGSVYFVTTDSSYDLGKTYYTITGEEYDFYDLDDVYELIGADFSHTEDETYNFQKIYYAVTAVQYIPAEEETPDMSILYENIDGFYVKTSDTEYDDEKTYYTLTGTMCPVYFYELDNDAYVLTSDTEKDDEKTYYTVTGTIFTAYPPDVDTLYELSSSTYAKTEDVAYNPNKTYYYVNGTAVTTPVSANLGTYYELSETYKLITPEGNPGEQGLYEFGGISESIQDYISTHVAVLDDGMYIQTSENGQDYRIRLSGQGVDIIDSDGQIAASYGKFTQIGRDNAFYIKLEGNELGFYASKDVVNEVTVERKIAWLSKNQLYINQTTVQYQMDLGVPLRENGGGQWSFKLHSNPAKNNKSNLYLKWLG